MKRITAWLLAALSAASALAAPVDKAVNPADAVQALHVQLNLVLPLTDSPQAVVQALDAHLAESASPADVFAARLLVRSVLREEALSVARRFIEGAARPGPAAAVGAELGTVAGEFHGRADKLDALRTAIEGTSDLKSQLGRLYENSRSGVTPMRRPVGDRFAEARKAAAGRGMERTRAPGSVAPAGRSVLYPGRMEGRSALVISRKKGMTRTFDVIEGTIVPLPGQAIGARFLLQTGKGPREVDSDRDEVWVSFPIVLKKTVSRP